jgi:hypothetical protein
LLRRNREQPVRKEDIMTADELTQLTTTALDTLAEALDRGRSEALTSLLRAMSRFHRYSLNNAWLIAVQRPDATLVAGFHAWEGQRRFVRRGEQGIAILAPIVRRRKEAKDEDERAVVGFRPAYVFDVSQTDGEPLPDVAQPTGEPGHALLRMRAAIASRSITLDYADALGGALGLSSGGRICVLRELSPASEFVVLAHEFAHLCERVGYVGSGAACARIC